MRTGATDRALAYTGAPVRLNELFDVVFRWAHLIAGIMWIGNSMLFNWLDRNLEKRGPLAPLSQGKIYMVHSGAFYDVEKKLLEPGAAAVALRCRRKFLTRESSSEWNATTARRPPGISTRSAPTRPRSSSPSSSLTAMRSA